MPSLIAAFLLTAPLVVLEGNDDMASLPQTVWMQIGVPLLLIARFVSREAPKRPQSIALKLVGVFLVWAGLSLLWATDAYPGQRGLFRWIAAASLTFLIADAVESPVEARKLLLALFSASVVVSGVGLLQHLLGVTAIPQAFPPAGTLGNKNVAAGFVAVMMPVGVYAVSRARRWVFLPAAGMGMGLAFIVHAGSRGAWLALMVQLIAAVWLLPRFGLLRRWRRGEWRAVATAAIVFVALVVRTPASGSEAHGQPMELLAATARPVLRSLGASDLASAETAAITATQERAERSIEIRLGVWRNSIAMIRSAPFLGVGLGNFTVHYPRFARSGGPDRTRIDERVDHAHNDFLEMVAELGLVGAAILAFATVGLVRVLLGSSSGASEDRSLAATSFLGLLALGALAGVSPTFNQPAMLVAAGTFIGVALRRCVEIESAAAALAPFRGDWKGMAVLCGASAALVFATSWGVAEIRADRHVLTMTKAEAIHDWSVVVQAGLAARRLNPERVGPLFATATALLRLGRAEEAAGLLQELVAVDPHNANAFGNLGIAYAMLGEHKRSAVSFEQVLRLRPDDPIALERLGRIQAPTGVKPYL